MSGEGDRESRDDSFLRAVAAAPPRAVDPFEDAPEKVAHFRILGRLGSGGMGVVYRARDELLRRDVALKLLPPSYASDPDRRLRFLREARAAGALVHPNVAIVHQVGEADGRVFIAMELVEGTTLRARVSEGPLPIQTVRDWSEQIADGLAAAHAKSVVHRDLKPENVMVTKAGVVKLLDFGLAKSGWLAGTESDLARADTEAQVTREGDMIGSPAYMSPEQVLGLPVDARSDVFALGIVMYEMLRGARPFRGTTLGEIRAAVVREPPARLPSKIEPALARVVMKCLEKSAAARYPDAGAVAADLRSRALASGPTAFARKWWRALAALIAASGLASMIERSVARRQAKEAPTASARVPSVASLESSSAPPEILRGRLIRTRGDPLEVCVTAFRNPPIARHDEAILVVLNGTHVFPTTLVVPPSTRVVFENRDAVPHRLYDESSTTWTAKDLQPKARREWTAATVGRFWFLDELFPDLKSYVVVTPDVQDVAWPEHSGNFTFSELPAGEYVIRAFLDGDQVGNAVPVTVNGPSATDLPEAITVPE